MKSGDISGEVLVFSHAAWENHAAPASLEYDRLSAHGTVPPRMADGISPELLGRLLDEQGGALALFAAQWTDGADDCVQEALIELARQQPVPDNPVAWLFRVVRNRAISRARSARRRERHESLAWRVKPHESAGRAGDGREGEAPAEPEDVAAALATLPLELREVIVARTWGGLGFEQIAELVGCSTSTAHRRYAAGLAALRERLDVTCPTHAKTSVPKS